MSHTMSLELSQELLRNSIIGLAGEPVFVDFESFLFVAQASSKDIHMVPDTTVTHLSSDSLISYGKINVPVSDIIGLATPPVHIVQLVSSGSGFARMNRQVCA